MAYVITRLCEGVCDTACASVCPVDAIHGPLTPREIEGLSGPERARRQLQLFIDPLACICCGACEPVCPAQAIFDECDVPAAHREDIERNAAFFDRSGSAGAENARPSLPKTNDGGAE